MPGQIRNFNVYAKKMAIKKCFKEYNIAKLDRLLKDQDGYYYSISDKDIHVLMKHSDCFKL